MSKKYMVFVDGTNLLSQIGRVLEIGFDAQKPPLKVFDEAMSINNTIINPMILQYGQPVRKFWFGSYKGTEDYCYQLREYLRLRSYEPVLFKAQGNKEKGVDIALTRQMLLNAFQQNYDVGLVVAGDEDYVELINDIKRYGIVVFGAFFDAKGLSKELKITFDQFFDFGKENWVENNIVKIKDRILKDIKKNEEASNPS